MSYKSNVRELRKLYGETQSALAGALGVTQQAVAKWESGASTADPLVLVRLAEHYDVSTDYLLGRDGAASINAIPYSTNIQLPVVGTVKAGFGSTAYQDHLGYEPAHVRNPEEYFYLQVHGDSMEPYIRDGDLALIHCQHTLENGDLGIIMYGDEEGTLKRYIKTGEGVVLQPFNTAYEPIMISGAALERLYIIGRVVETKTRW